MASPLEVTELLGVIRDFYGRDSKGNFKFSLTERITALWCDDLSDLPAAELWLAFKQHRNSPGGEWPPAPNQLRKHVTTMTRTELPDWGGAWSEVLAVIARYGSYSEPDASSWSNPLIPSIIRGMGGWKLMCSMEIANTSTDRAQFRMLYEAAVSRATRTADLLPEVRALAVKNGALPAPTEPAPKALPAPTQPRDAAPRPILAVLPAAIKANGQTAPKNADDEYRERVKRAQADPSGPEAQAFAAQAEQMRRAALAMATRQTEQEAAHA